MTNISQLLNFKKLSYGGIVESFLLKRISKFMIALFLQHRGQDSTGIATMENTIFHIHKAKGQVNTAYRTRDMRNLIGKIGLGHVRYATKGSAESVEEAQPFYVNAPYGIVLIHNGNLTTTDLEKQLFNVDKRHTTFK